MKPTPNFRIPALARRHPVFLIIGVVLLVGILTGSYWMLLRPAIAEPPAIALDGVEKPVADAIRTAQQRLEEQPRSAEAWGQLGKVLLAHSFNQQADQCFAQAEKLDDTQPRWPYYRGLIAASEDGPRALTYLCRAAELSDRSDPNNFAIRLRLAELLVELGQTEEAEAQFRLVAAKDPNNPRLLYNWGVLALARGEQQTALDCLSRLTKHPAARKKACAQLAMLYRRLADESQAAKFTQLATQLPGDAPWEDHYAEEYKQLQVDALGRLQQVRTLEAEGKIREVLALLYDINQGADSDLAHTVLGINLLKVGQYDEAEKALRQTLALYPDKVQAHFFLAVVLFVQAEAIAGRDQGLSAPARAKYHEAASHFRRVLELKPDHALAHMNLGRTLLALGQRDEGLKELRAAVTSKPEEARPHFFLAEALADTGQIEEGRQHLELAMRLAGKEDSLPSAATLQRIREKLDRPK
jgi:tetratricopeptide (TPR) repeat protein